MFAITFVGVSFLIGLVCGEFLCLRRSFVGWCSANGCGLWALIVNSLALLFWKFMFAWDFRCEGRFFGVWLISLFLLRV